MAGLIRDVTSNKVTLTVLQPAGPLTITKQPKSAAAKKGSYNSVTYTVEVKGGKAQFKVE